MKKHPTSRSAASFVAGGCLAALFLAGAAQAITDTNFKYSTPQTGFLNIPPTAWVSKVSDNAYGHANDVLRVSTNDENCFAAPVYLPEGAVMSEYAAWYSNDGGTLTLALFRRANSADFSEQIATKGLQGTSFGVTAVAKKSLSGDAAKVDNQHYSYWMDYCATNSANAWLMNVRVTYTYIKAGD